MLEVHLKLPPLPMSTAGNTEIELMRSALCEIQGAITKAQREHVVSSLFVPLLVALWMLQSRAA